MCILRNCDKLEWELGYCKEHWKETYETILEYHVRHGNVPVVYERTYAAQPVYSRPWPKPKGKRAMHEAHSKAYNVAPVPPVKTLDQIRQEGAQAVTRAQAMLAKLRGK